MGTLGHRGHKQHKNKPSTGYQRCFRPGFGCYGRGNFPGHHVLCVLPEMVKNECIWVFLDMYGCIGSYGNGREKKQDKKSPKRARQQCQHQSYGHFSDLFTFTNFTKQNYHFSQFIRGYTSRMILLNKNIKFIRVKHKKFYSGADLTLPNQKMSADLAFLSNSLLSEFSLVVRGMGNFSYKELYL